jgi:hypothetical protein
VIALREDPRELRGRVLEQRREALRRRSFQQRKRAFTFGDQTFELRPLRHVVADELPDQVRPPIRGDIEDGVDEAFDPLPIVRWEIA